MPQFRHIAKSKLLSGAAKQAVTVDVDPRDIGLMTLQQYMKQQNSEGTTHPSTAYDFDLERMNQDYAVRELGRSGDGKLTYTQHAKGITVEAEGKLVAVSDGHTLWVKHPLKDVPRRCYDRGVGADVELGRAVQVKYPAEFLGKVFDPSATVRQEYPFLVQNTGSYEVRARKDPSTGKGVGLAVIHNGLIVGIAEDEWGATLISVAREYRGQGLGPVLLKLWSQFNPTYTSGGYTPAGKAMAIRVWSDRVRELLSHGVYSDLVARGSMTRAQAEAILKDLRQRSPGGLPTSPAGTAEGTGKMLLYLDGPAFVIYDAAFLQNQDPAFIKAHGFMRDSEHAGSFFYTLDYVPAFREAANTIALQMARDERVSLYVGEGYADMLEPGDLPVERDGNYLKLKQDVADLQVLAAREKAARKKVDPHGEILNLLLEEANSKEWDAPAPLGVWSSLHDQDWSSASGNKIVDKQGQPLPVYHGSPTHGITEFDPKAAPIRPRTGIEATYFTSDPYSANAYRGRGGGVYAAHILIRNPLDITKVIKRFQAKGLSFGQAKAEALKAYDPATHDGVVFRGDSVNSDEFMVPSQAQIRLLKIPGKRAAGEIGSGEHAATTHGQFWGSAGAGCIFYAADTGRILLPFRSEWVNEPRTWGVWGGAIDPGEDARAAALREVREEAGYTGQCHLIEAHVFTKGDFRYTNFVAVVPKEFQPRLNWETERFAWVAPDQLPEPLHFGLKAALPGVMQVLQGMKAKQASIYDGYCPICGSRGCGGQCYPGGKRAKHSPGYEKESEEIRKRSKTPEAQKPHKFQRAEWLFPNGHPRCKVCGGEETMDGVCPGRKSGSNNEDTKGQCHCEVCGAEIIEGRVCSECAKTCQKCGGFTRNCRCASFVHAKDGLCHDCYRAPKAASERSAVGFNVNDSQMPWTSMILKGEKTVETRDSDSLRPHVGERVGLIRTGVGPATLVGYCVLGEPKVYRTNEEFRADDAKHRIPAGPEWDLQPGAVKFGYPLSNVEPCEPQEVTGQGRVWRKLAAAQDVTQIPAFKSWFAGSKVVDKRGNPLVVYHGTQASFESFDGQRQGESVSGRGGDIGFFFVDDPEAASDHAMADWGRDDPNPNVMPVFLSMRNPAVVDGIGQPSRWYDNYGREASLKALSEGKDGLIIGNEGGVHLFVVFRSTQIKSAIGNSGNFDPSDHRITASERLVSPWVYTGSPTRIEEWEDRPDGIWFTTSRESAEDYGDYVYCARVTMQRPYVTTGSDFNSPQGKNIPQVRGEGHDGLVIRSHNITGGDEDSGTEGDTYVVFHAAQIEDYPGPVTASTSRTAVDPVASAIASVYEGAPLWDILTDFGPSDGGCLICAKAIIEAFGGTLVRIVSKASGRSEHYGALRNGIIYDFNGSWSSAQAWVKGFSELEHLTVPCTVEQGLGEPGEIPSDPEKEKAISALLMEAAQTRKKASLPRAFYIALSNQGITERLLKALETGELRGVKGVSTDLDGIWQHTAASSVVLKMPGPGFLADNPEVRPVDYRLESILADNMRTYLRLSTNASTQTAVAYLVQMAVTTAARHCDAPPVVENAAARWLNARAAAGELNVPDVNDFRGLVTAAKSVLKQLDAGLRSSTSLDDESRDAWKETLRDTDVKGMVSAIVNAVARQTHEREWLLNAPSLKIPGGSTVMVSDRSVGSPTSLQALLKDDQGQHVISLALARPDFHVGLFREFKRETFDVSMAAQEAETSSTLQSKMAAAAPRPAKVVYHGTDADFETFRDGNFNWFTESLEDARDYNATRVVSARLTINNPANLDSPKVRRLLQDELPEVMDDGEVNLFYLSEYGPEVREVLTNAGFDGLYVERPDLRTAHWGAFRPDQVEVIETTKMAAAKAPKPILDHDAARYLKNDYAEAHLEFERDGYWFENVLQQVPLDEIEQAAPWHPEREAKNLQLLKETGAMPPVRLSLWDDGTYRISDGIHRVNAARQLGYKTVPAIVSIKRTTPPPAVKGVDERRMYNLGWDLLRKARAQADGLDWIEVSSSTPTGFVGEVMDVQGGSWTVKGTRQGDGLSVRLEGPDGTREFSGSVDTVARNLGTALQGGSASITSSLNLTADLDFTQWGDLTEWKEILEEEDFNIPVELVEKLFQVNRLTAEWKIKGKIMLLDDEVWLYFHKKNRTFSLIKDIQQWVYDLDDMDVWDLIGDSDNLYNAHFGGTLKEFREHPSEVYHWTTEENWAAIKASGALHSTTGSGLTNRSTVGIFTTADPEELADGTYGSVCIRIDLPRLLRDHPEVTLSFEPEVEEALAREMVAGRLGVEMDTTVSPSGGMSYTTVIIGAREIPLAYLANDEDPGAPQDEVRTAKLAAWTVTKQDIMAVRSFLRDWVGGGWDDRDRNARLALKHEAILSKFKPSKPLRLWRNERIQGPNGVGGLNNHGWEDQYKFPTAWSVTRHHAETYAAGPGRRLVTAVVPPEDMLVSIPMIDQAARELGLKPIDRHAQDEIVVKANPSFLAQLRPPVRFTQEEEQQVRGGLLEKLRAYYAPQIQKMQEAKPGSAQSIAHNADQQIQGMVSSIPTEELPEKVKEWEAKILEWSGKVVERVSSLRRSRLLTKTAAFIGDIYLDMDGVLGDYEKAANAAGVHPKAFKNVPGAFRHLEVLDGSREAVAALLEAFPGRVHICSTPSGDRFEDSCREKLEWAAEEFPGIPQNHIHLVLDKSTVGTKRDALIDDHPEWNGADKFPGRVFKFEGPHFWEPILDTLIPGWSLGRAVNE